MWIGLFVGYLFNFHARGPSEHTDAIWDGRIFLLSLLLLIIQPAVSAEPRTPPMVYDIFYLAVGNSFYASDSDPQGFKNLEGANKSAKKVAAYLDRAGARAGLTLVSENRRFVTRADVLKALNEILLKAKKSGAENPLVIFYFCGHGISESIGWNHFSVPGDFSLPVEKVSISTLASSAIYAGEVADAIEDSKVSGLLLLDACYEGREAELPEAVISRQLAENLTNMFKVLRYLNEFHGPTMAVFSTKPGTLVPLVQDPLDEESQLGVGPLARRLMLSFESTFSTRKTLTVEQFLRQMSDAAFDEETSSIITLSAPEKPSMKLIRYPLNEQSRGEVRAGSGHGKGKPNRRLPRVRFSASARSLNQLMTTSRRNHARASRQSRATVASETPSSSAISCML